MLYDHCGSDMCPASSRVSCACSCAWCMNPRDVDDDRVCGLPASSCKADVATLKAAIAESDIRIAGVEAERDHYRVGLAESERARAEVVRERDALKAGKWARPWGFFDGTEYVRMSNTDSVAASARSHGMAGTFGWYSNHLRTDFVGYASIDLAKAACDAALLAAGWYLAKSSEDG